MLEYNPSQIIEKNPELIITSLSEYTDLLKFKKGQAIYVEGSTPLGVYFVKKGMVKISQLGSDGKEQIMTIAVENEMLNCSDMVLNSRYSTSAEVMEETELYFVPKQDFWTIIKKEQPLFEQFVLLLADELKFVETKMTNLAYKPVRGRLADALIYLYEKSNRCEPDKPCIAISRYDLACFVGTAKETVNRLMSEFRNDKMIETEGTIINVIDPHGLKKISHMYD